MTELLLRTDTGPVARLTMNAPATLNALSDEMLAALHNAFTTLMTDTRIRVVILAGAGRAFCAGHDLRQMQAARQSPAASFASSSTPRARNRSMVVSRTTSAWPLVSPLTKLLAVEPNTTNCPFAESRA